MHRIYLEKKCMIICPPGEGVHGDPDSMEISLDDGRTDIHSLVPLFENSESLRRIFLYTNDVENAYKEFCSDFKEVEAGGGLVTDSDGRVLLIKRKGLWDLPKGHREAGERMEDTAVREVREETGIGGIQLDRLACVTDHCYFRKEKWHLKHTWWYWMTGSSSSPLTPQKDEDITDAIWIPRQCLASYLLNTFPSIIEVIRSAGI